MQSADIILCFIRKKYDQKIRFHGKLAYIQSCKIVLTNNENEFNLGGNHKYSVYCRETPKGH